MPIRVLRALMLLMASIFLVACSTKKSDPSTAVHVPNDAWWNQLANTKTGSDPQKNVATVRKKLAAVSPIPFSIAFSESKEINAFASLQNGQNLIVLTNGFILQFGNDPDVLATVLGHELGHHQLGHTQPDYGKNRDIGITAASQALGMLSNYFIPFGGLLVGNAVKTAGLTYNRDDERDADTFGMKLGLAAGYSPCGSYRFAAKMKELGQGPALTFLSTHPGNDERLENSENFSVTSNGMSCSSLQ